MNSKNFILFLFFALSTFLGKAQQLFTTAGNTGSATGVHLDYSIGEPIIVTNIHAQHQITQGFQQPLSNGSAALITVTGTLNQFSACSGSVSAEQNFSVTGSSLTGDLTVTPPTGYEVSTSSGSGYSSSSITLYEIGGSVSATVYARLTSSASDGASGNITISGGGATTADVATGTGVVSHSVYFVDDGLGSNSNAGTSSGSPFLTLTYAVSKVGGCASTTINVAAGTYTDESINITTDNLTIDGAGSSTIFDGDLDGRFLTINASNVTISDMKIKEYGLTSSCNTSGRCGGGAIEVGDASTTRTNILFSGITFTDNQTDGSSGDGGAVEVLHNCTATFNQCIFNGNKAKSAASSSSNMNGGALKHNSGSTLTLNNCLFYENQAGGQGGAYATWGGTSSFNNCTFADNYNYGEAGAVMCSNDGSSSANVALYNCIIYGNYHSGSLDRDLYENSGTMTARFCIYRSANSSVTINNNVGTSDPSFSDAANDDYSLQSSSDGIDAGSASYAPATDILGVSRPQGAADDIGCYEYVSPTWDGSSSTDWGTADNWSTNSVPVSSQSVIIADVTNQPTISSAVTIAGLTISSGAEMTVSSNSLTVTGVTDIDGEINIDNATVNLDGSVDFTNGTIDFTHVNGKITLSGAVTSLGTLDDASGTVEYDGANNTVVSATYYNLTISTAGTKTASGDITVNNDLTTAATTNCKLDMGANSLVIKGDLNVGAIDGLDLTDVSCVLTMSGSSYQNVTHAGATVTGTEVSETGESGLGGFLTTGNVSFTTTSSYYKNGSNCIYNDYTSDDNNYLTSTANIDLSSYASAELSFWHIAKTEGGYDKCRVQYSDNGGSSWTTFPNSKYEGSAGDYSSKEYFHEDSYATWGTSSETINNTTWWKQETFDMDFLSGQNDIRIRFWLQSDGSIQREGWYIDDIVVSGSNSSGSEFKNLTIYNSAGITLSSDIEISGTLNLASGGINTNGKTLHVTASGSVTGSKGTTPCNCIYPDAYTQELTTTSAVEFRTGNSGGTERKSIWVQPENANSVTFSADFIDNVHGDASDCGTGLDHISSASYYDVSRTAGTENAKVKIGWYTNDQVDDYASLLLAHYDGSQWQKVVSTPTGSNTSGTIISDGFQSSFSPFALGSSNSGNALPIDLLSFGGECENGRVQLEFVVASQVNNDYFTIERSMDAYKWNEVGVIAGEGNTNTQVTYNWTDDNPFNGVSYYRLAQTDYDGITKRFDPIAVSCETLVTGYSVYPNPANEVLNIDIELTSHQGNDVEIEIVDINGRVIQSQNAPQLDRGYNHLEVDLSEIPSGVYMINFAGTRDYIKESHIVIQ